MARAIRERRSAVGREAIAQPGDGLVEQSIPFGGRVIRAVVLSLKDVQMRFDGEWIEAEFEPLARPVAAS